MTSTVPVLKILHSRQKYFTFWQNCYNPDLSLNARLMDENLTKNITNIA